MKLKNSGFSVIELLPILMVLGILIAFGVDFYRKVTADADSCVRQHKGLVHHEAYTSFMFIGKVMIPHHHPAADSEDWICDERRAK